jgi:hypothetical protein
VSGRPGTTRTTAKPGRPGELRGSPERHGRVLVIARAHHPNAPCLPASRTAAVSRAHRLHRKATDKERTPLPFP